MFFILLNAAEKVKRAPNPTDAVPKSRADGVKFGQMKDERNLLARELVGRGRNPQDGGTDFTGGQLEEFRRAVLSLSPHWG